MKKHNRKMARSAAHRADKRWSGAQKILKFIARGAPIDHGPRGMFVLQQKYGV